MIGNLANMNRGKGRFNSNRKERSRGCGGFIGTGRGIEGECLGV